jgi:hypothetical protein
VWHAFGEGKVYSIPRGMSTVFSASRLTIRLVDTRAEGGQNIDRVYRMGIVAISSKLHEAGWREISPNRKLHGYLCLRHGEIGEGLPGFCFIRQNIGERLYNLGDAQPAVMKVDPTRGSRSTTSCSTRGFFPWHFRVITANRPLTGTLSSRSQSRLPSVAPAGIVCFSRSARCTRDLTQPNPAGPLHARGGQVYVKVRPGNEHADFGQNDLSCELASLARD